MTAINRHGTAVTSMCLVLAAIAVNSNSANAQSPSGKALLRGAEQVRSRYESLRVELTFEVISPAPATKTKCLIEMDGKNRRFERVASANTRGSVVLIDGDEVYAYERLDNSDVRLCDMTYVVGTSGDLAFDPRILGLTDLPSANTSVKACLWYDNGSELEVQGKDRAKGIDTWRVRTRNQTVTSTYWIEEPSFRVHERTLEWPQGRSEIRSEYDSPGTDFPFPSHVRIKRTDGDRSTELRIDVSSFDVDAKIEPERFTLASMDLPINTMVIDYRTQRVVGYWNGTDLSENPFYPNQSADAGDATSSDRRLWFICANVIVMISLVVLIWWSRRAT